MKRNIILAGILAITLDAAAQSNSVYKDQKNNATITVDIAGIQDTAISVYYGLTDPQEKLVLRPDHGKLTWKGHVSSPSMALMLFSGGLLNFFIEGSDMTIEGNMNAPSDIKVKGSASNDEYQRFMASIKDLEEESTKVRKNYGRLPDNEQLALEQHLIGLLSQRRQRVYQYIAAHPLSQISIYLTRDGSMEGEFRLIDSAFHLLAPAALKTEAGMALIKRLPVIKRRALGEKIVDFHQADTSGNMIGIAAFRGKYVLVDFWASWCGPCRAENPNVLKAYNEWKARNFTVLGVSLDKTAEPWKQAIVKDGMPWAQVSDLKGWNNELADYYKVRGIPFNLLIDPEGRIVAKDLRGAMLHKRLQEIIQ